MKAAHTFAIDFIIRLVKFDKNCAHIFVRITVNGDRKEISIKEKINSKDWDSAREIVRGKSEEVRTINQRIDDIRFRIKEKYKLLEENECEITAEALKEAYLDVHQIQKMSAVFSAFRFFSDEKDDRRVENPILFHPDVFYAEKR